MPTSVHHVHFLDKPSDIIFLTLHSHTSVTSFRFRLVPVSHQIFYPDFFCEIT